MEPLMTSDEVASYLRVDVVTIRRLVNRGDLAAYRIGGEYRFTKSDLEDYLQRQRISGGEGYSNDLPEELTQQAPKWPTSDRFDKFTEQARKVLQFAQEEAQRFRHNYIGTEHLLLGIVCEGEGVATQVLSNLGIELNQVRSKVESIIGRGGRIVSGAIGLTPRAKKVMELSIDEARRFDHHYVGTEHLLLALIRLGDGIAVDVLASFGVDLEKARSQTLKVLNTRQTPNSPPVPAEAALLVAENEQAITCTQCGAHSPAYFRYCFNCGKRLLQ